jgi:hypothetical protein
LEGRLCLGKDPSEALYERIPYAAIVIRGDRVVPAVGSEAEKAGVEEEQFLLQRRRPVCFA